MKTYRAASWLLLILSFTGAQAKQKLPAPLPLTPDQTALVRRAIAAERITIGLVRQRAPLVQTYIQKMGEDAEVPAPSSDQYMLERVDFGKRFRAQTFQVNRPDDGLYQESSRALHGISQLFGFHFVANGFLDMIFIDPSGFDEGHYQFSYVRRSFLGSIRTAEFDVTPKVHTGNGRFIGRIWVDDDSGNIVRFNGTYSGSGDGPALSYFHLDSWRQNLQDGLWLPVGVYVEESSSRRGPRQMDFKAQTQIWGYSLKKPEHAFENESIRIDNVVDHAEADDLNPVQARRAWIARAAENVMDRLTEGGLVAKPSDFDSVLETVTNNLVIGNNLDTAGPVHCRVMLTTPLESMAIGNTIVLSRGLIDTLPSESALAAVIAFQLAHIVLGHHVDTRYAFDDRLLFPDDAVLQRIHMQQTDEDNAAAAVEAMILLDGSIYKDKESEAGLYFLQLEARRKTLTALNSPRLGDSLLDAQGVPWMYALTGKTPPLVMKDLNQLGALPLGSRLRVNAWDDSVSSLNAKATPLVNVREKMPFEVAPLYFSLTTFARDDAQHAFVANPSP